jgi:hypothetical protein
LLQPHPLSTLSPVLRSPFLCRGIESWNLLKTGSKVATAEPNVFWRGSGRHAVTPGFYVMIGVGDERYKRVHAPTTIPIFDFYGRQSPLCSMIFCSVVPARQQKKCERQSILRGWVPIAFNFSHVFSMLHYPFLSRHYMHTSFLETIYCLSITRTLHG